VDLSIVIVNWNSGSYLCHLLESLVPLRNEIDKIVVIDNGSTDASESAASATAGVTLKKFHKNQGFARAANLGIGEAGTPFILLLNPDIRILPQAVRGLVREMKGRPRTGIACCSLKGEQGESQKSFQIRSFPTFSSVVMDSLFVDDFLSFFRPSQSLSPRTQPFEVEQPAAAFWLLRNEAWRQIGGFDEDFFPAWFEDVDFCKRLWAAGWNIMFFPQWYVIHRGGLSLEHLTRENFTEIYYTNLLKYWKKHHRRSLPLLRLPVRLGIVMRKLLVRHE